MAHAPVEFGIMPPPKIIDLTSDFFQSGAIKLPQGHRRTLSHQPPPREKRMIINNPRQNAIMVDLGKCRIRQLLNFQG